MKPAQPTITPMYVDPAQLRGIKNMKPCTYPAQPMDPDQMVSKALVVEIPKKEWDSDWLVDMTNDIAFLEHHFQCGVGDYVWLREAHRLHICGGDRVKVEYPDGEERFTTLLVEEVNFDGRKVPPVAMRKLACRHILKVREIGVRWADEAKRTRLIWVVGIERMPDAQHLLEQEKRGVLK